MDQKSCAETLQLIASDEAGARLVQSQAGGTMKPNDVARALIRVLDDGDSSRAGM
jgi:hypothetical protein